MATLPSEEKAGNVSTCDKQMEKIYLNPRLLRVCEVSWRVWDMHTIEAEKLNKLIYNIGALNRA